MLEVLDLAEVGIRALGFWLWVFSPKYRAQVASEWRAAGVGRRAMMTFEYFISAAIGLGIPVLAWVLLT